MIFYVLYLLHDLYPDRLKSAKALVLYVIGTAFVAMFFMPEPAALLWAWSWR